MSVASAREEQESVRETAEGLDSADKCQVVDAPRYVEGKGFSAELIRETVSRILGGLAKSPKTIVLFEEGCKRHKILGQDVSGETLVAYFGEKLGGLNIKRIGVAFTTCSVRYNLKKEGVLSCSYAKGRIGYSEIQSIGLVADASGTWELFINDEAIGVFITGNESFGWGDVADDTTCNSLSILLAEHSPKLLGSLGRANAELQFCELPDGFVVEDYLNAKSFGPKGLPTVTLSLISLCAIAFVIQLLNGSFADDVSFVEFANSFGAESYLGYFVCGFLHGGWIHFLSNMACLWSLGKSAERLFGKMIFLSLYLISICGGGLFASIMHPGVLTVGASGGIFGLASALAIYGGVRCKQIRNQAEVPRVVHKEVVRWAAENCAFLVQNIFFTFKFAKMFSISVGGHLGGVFAGMCCGVVLLVVRRFKGTEYN